MTAEQLEELLAALSDDNAFADANVELCIIAPSLARRVLAAEKLAAEVERVSFSDNAIAMLAALTAYREASK